MRFGRAKTSILKNPYPIPSRKERKWFKLWKPLGGWSRLGRSREVGSTICWENRSWIPESWARSTLFIPSGTKTTSGPQSGATVEIFKQTSWIGRNGSGLHASRPLLLRNISSGGGIGTSVEERSRT